MAIEPLFTVGVLNRMLGEQMEERPSTRNICQNLLRCLNGAEALTLPVVSFDEGPANISDFYTRHRKEYWPKKNARLFESTTVIDQKITYTDPASKADRESIMGLIALPDGPTTTTLIGYSLNKDDTKGWAFTYLPISVLVDTDRADLETMKSNVFKLENLFPVRPLPSEADCQELCRSFTRMAYYAARYQDCDDVDVITWTSITII